MVADFYFRLYIRAKWLFTPGIRFLIIGLILAAPVGQFLFRRKRAMPASAGHDPVDFRSRTVDKVPDSPAFPDMFRPIYRFYRTHGGLLFVRCILVLREPQEIVKRPRAVIQRYFLAVTRCANFERIGQAVALDASPGAVVVPCHIGQRVQLPAECRDLSFVLRIDSLQIPITLREILHPVVYFPFSEDSDTVRFGLFVEGHAVGVVVRISKGRPIAMKVVIGFRVSVFDDEEQNTVASEARIYSFDMVRKFGFVVVDSIEQIRFRNEPTNRIQHRLRPVNHPVQRLFGIGENQFVESLPVDPSYHRRDTCLRQDSVSRR